jgi:hypothetical protein
VGTVLDTIISPALRKLGVLGAGETLASEDAADALSALNNLLDQFAIERLAIWHLERTTFTITSGQQVYTLGVSAANELYNGDFESGFYTPDGGTSSVPNGWRSSGPGVISSSVITHGGSHSVQINAGPAGSATYIYQSNPATSNQAWELDGWIRLGTGLSFADVYIYDVANALYLQNDGVTWAALRDVYKAVATVGSYSEVTGSFTTHTSGVESLQLQLEASGSIALDKAQFDDFTFGPVYTAQLVRPQFIDHVTYQDTDLDPVQEYPMQPLTDDAWAAIPQKDLTNTIPTSWYYNPTYPNGTIYLWPVPTSTSLEGVIYAPTAITQFSTLTENVSLPPGYPRMLVSNLALELCPDYQITPHPALIDQARDSKAAVKRANKRPMDMSFDGGALVQGSTALTYDIRIGP